MNSAIFNWDNAPWGNQDERWLESDTSPQLSQSGTPEFVDISPPPGSPHPPAIFQLPESAFLITSGTNFGMYMFHVTELFEKLQRPIDIEINDHALDDKIKPPAFIMKVGWNTMGFLQMMKVPVGKLSVDLTSHAQGIGLLGLLHLACFFHDILAGNPGLNLKKELALRLAFGRNGAIENSSDYDPKAGILHLYGINIWHRDLDRNPTPWAAWITEAMFNAYSLVAKCYNDENDGQCIKGSQYLLDNYTMSQLLRMKSYALISMASDDWFVAEQYRNRAEHIYATATNKLPRGTKLDKDFVNMRNELDELAQLQLENEPAEDQEEPTTEPLPQNLRVQYLLEDCEDADEIYNDNDLAAYADALQQILESGSVPALVALRLCILISSVVTDRSLAKVNWEIAEVLWEEQESEWDSQMPPDVDSFMQATRHALDSLSKNHQDAAATDAETVSQAGNTS
ncbi:hypothetical protein KCU77_g9177, partial [Aureobasidium melanogenum]